MRLLLADHHPTVLKALQTRLREEGIFVVVGTASDAKTLKKQAEAQRPDAILLDWELPGRDSQELIAILHKLEPRPRVIAMSSKLEKGRVALAAGADAFISKGEDSNWLIETLQILKSQTEGADK
ncbi:MAG: response regulator transcription factor [Anaerolineales bacterium]|jgi:two-component system capsular synthesis response regulator RcsB